MSLTSGKSSGERRVTCPFCETGQLRRLGPGFARCDSCALPLLGSMLETLREIVGLPDALGSHTCECGHPEMRELPGSVYHCPACRSEVLHTEGISDIERAQPGSVHLERNLHQVQKYAGQE